MARVHLLYHTVGFNHLIGFDLSHEGGHRIHLSYTSMCIIYLAFGHVEVTIVSSL